MRSPHLLRCDRQYRTPLATTLSSIVDAVKSGQQLEFHLLADGVFDRIQRKISTSLTEGFCVNPDLE